MFVTVMIDEETLLNMFLEELEGWHTDKEESALYEKMWKKHIEAGYYEGLELDISGWVDNDVINTTDTIYEGDDRFEELLELYKDKGTEYPIEAVNNESNPTMFLISVY